MNINTSHRLSLLGVFCLLLSGCGSIATHTPATITELPAGTPLEEIDIHENERNGHTAYHGDTLAATYASAGDVVRLEQPVGPFPENALLLYFNDTTQDETDGQKSFGLVYSLDEGNTWSDRVTVPIELPDLNFIAADASILQTEEGSLLVYFYALDPMGDHKKERVFYAASSLDGLTFTVEQEVYRTEDPYNSPEVVFHNEQWYLFLNIPEEFTAGMAVSDTPYDFGDLYTFSFPGILGAVSDGETLYAYDCPALGQRDVNILEYVVTDSNSDPVYQRDTDFLGCAPSPYLDQNGVLQMMSQK